MSNRMKGIVTVVIGILIAIMPTPEGLDPHAQYYFAVFVAVIVGLILEPIPAALVGLSGVSFAAIFGLVGETAKESRAWALGGFSNGVIWLIFAAFMFALGYKKSGLGNICIPVSGPKYIQNNPCIHMDTSRSSVQNET